MKVEGCGATSDTNVDIEIEPQNVYGATILGSFQLTFIVNDPRPAARAARRGRGQSDAVA
jgi:hypothetical protein